MVELCSISESVEKKQPLVVDVEIELMLLIYFLYCPTLTGRNSVRVPSAIVLLKDFAARRVQCISWFLQTLCHATVTI